MCGATDELHRVFALPFFRPQPRDVPKNLLSHGYRQAAMHAIMAGRRMPQYISQRLTIIGLLRRIGNTGRDGG
jgi:hypothetical protein